MSELGPLLDDLVLDAQRYRWLKRNHLMEAAQDDGTLCVYFLCDFENYNDLDAAIDSAMQSSPTPAPQTGQNGAKAG